MHLELMLIYSSLSHYFFYFQTQQLELVKRSYGADVKVSIRGVSELYVHHNKEHTAVNKKLSKVERDAFEWLLHNLQNHKLLNSPKGLNIPVSTPEILYTINIFQCHKRNVTKYMNH